MTSQLQLKAYLAKKELAQAQIEKSAQVSPSVIARQQLRVLASIQNLLFENQLLQERVLATLSVIGLEGLRKDILNVGRETQPLIGDLNAVLNGATRMPNPNDPSSGKTKINMKGITG